MGLKTYDPAEYLNTEEDIRHYLEAAFEDGDPAIIKNALANAARARGMTEIASKAGITRAGLYKAIGEDGNPSFATMASILNALGLRLTVTTAG
jgi:probable addiction module antidote protein